MTTIRLQKCPAPKRALATIAALLAGLVFTSAAPAQSGTWKWLDAQGRTVYSDRPPLPGERVTQLKAPDGRSPAGVSSTTPAGPHADASEVGDATGGEAAAAGAASAPGPAAASNGAQASADAASGFPNWVERGRQSRERAAARAEAEARQAELSRQMAERQRACEETRVALRTLESGVRMHSVNDKGERIALDDAERARRAETLRRALGENCARPPT